MGGGDTTVQAPQPTAEELGLMREQTELLRQQRSMFEAQLRTQELLAPFLYKEVGLRPQFSQDVDPELASRLADLDTKIGEAQQRLAALPQAAEQRPGDPFPISRVRSNAAARQALEREIAQLQNQRETLSGQAEATRGRIVGFEELPEDPSVLRQRQLQELFQEESLSALQRERASSEANAEIEGLTRQRTLAALKGELPVNPALLSQLGREEQTLRESLFKQLGPGFETSTPGIQALAEFSQRKSEILEGARRADLTLGEQLRFAQEAGRRDLAVTGTDISSRLRQQQLGNVMGISQQNIPVIQGFGGVAQGFSQPLSFLSDIRARQFQADMASAQLSQQNMAGWGQLFGAGLGAYATYAGLAASDERVKENIQFVGQTEDGYNIYSFRYIGDDEERLGFLAQEVEEVTPEAVIELPNGFKLVDYEVALNG